MKNRILSELTLGFLLGGFPVLLTYLFGDQDLLIETIRGLSPDRLLLWYYIILGVLAWWLLLYHGRTFLRDDEARRRRRYWGAVLRELPGAGLGILRAASGFLLVFSALWALDDSASKNIASILWAVGSGLIGTAGCVALTNELAKRTPASIMNRSDIRLR